MTRVAAIFNPHHNPPEALGDAVRAAEAAGVSELWLWEDCFRQSAFAPAAVALARTQRLRIGIGITPMPLRNVAATAMEIATIERMFPGRLLPGVGHGVQAWMGQAGARAKSPLTLMREYVPALRSLLAGQEVTFSGQYVCLDRVRLDLPPAVAPRVYTSAQGPRTLELNGRVADGTILDSRHSSAELAASVDTVRTARAAADRGDSHDIAAYVLTAFGPGAAERVRADAGEQGVDDDRALWGDLSDVVAGVQRIAGAGVDAVILQPATGEPDLAAFYGAAGEVARAVGG